MKTIYLFRHGEVEDAYCDRLRGGSTDCLLSPNGEIMSLENLRFIVAAGVQAVITTGLKRSDFVGERSKEVYGITHHRDERLKEMHLGKWEGQPLVEVNAAHPEAARQFVLNPLCGLFPGLENADVYQQRVMAGWADVLVRPEERIAVVAHGITNAVILRSIAGIGAGALKQTIGCMNEIHVDPPPRVVRQNVVLYPAGLAHPRGH